MEDTDDQDPGFIRIQLDMLYDARPQGFFAKAPKGWASMTPERRQRFLDNAAQEYLDEQINCHGTYYATAENDGGWSLAFSADDVEEMF